MERLVLHEFHEAAGGRFAELAGWEVVSEYADQRAEYEALRGAAGVLDLSFRGRVCLLGADRQRFLHGQVTNDVNKLRPGEGCYAALVSARGKLQSDVNIYRLDEEILLDFEPGLTLRVTERLEKFIIAEDVQVADVAAHYGLLSVQGPKAADILQRLSFPLPSQPRSIIKNESEVYISRSPRLGTDGFDLFVPADALRKVAGQLAGAATLCGWEAFEATRIEAGIPRFGVDMDETNLAPEALDSGAISYAKGCYIGQEVIARVRTYGQVAKSLRRLEFGAGAGETPSHGAKLLLQGKEAGYVTSAVRSPVSGALVGLGYVRREAASGAGLSVETGAGPVSVYVLDKSTL